jgi:pyridoxine kinase
MRRRWLSGIKITDMASLCRAIKKLHVEYRVPHIIITSVRLPSVGSSPHLSVVGSTILPTALSTSPSEFSLEPVSRMFKIDVPSIDCFFSGTGDMFAALILVRLREAVSKTPGLSNCDAWISPDDVEAVDLPLARAAELALASMHIVLERTKKHRDEEMEKWDATVGARETKEDEKAQYLRETKGAEVRLVRNLDALRNPVVQFKAERVEA